MKYVLVIIALSLLGFITPKTFAETSIDISNNGEGASSEVRVESSTGESTVCVNGNCTTTQNGGNSATVCINGNCETTQGNVDRQEGGAKVKIENNINGTNQSNPSYPPITSSPSPKQDSQPTASGSAEASISAKKDESSTSSASNTDNTRQFNFTELMNTISKMISDFFSQNK